MIRVGIGYDSHRFAAGRRLVLGGVEIPFPRGLAGHSDADALIHALIDAFLGAAALGDIGGFFPDGDPRWKGADSAQLLAHALAAVAAAGWRPVNVDATVVCEQPKLAPHLPAIRARLAEIIFGSADALGRVSVKGKTNERMDAVGAGEGIAVQAVCLLEKGTRQ
jgi:2-C-methyl-D-erythritol 2,4-cyclodiphosphate synthase